MELNIHHRRLAATAGGEGHILPQPFELKPSGPSPALITRALLPKFIVPWINIRRLCSSSNDPADFFNCPLCHLAVHRFAEDFPGSYR